MLDIYHQLDYGVCSSRSIMISCISTCTCLAFIYAVPRTRNIDLPHTPLHPSTLHSQLTQTRTPSTLPITHSTPQDMLFCIPPLFTVVFSVFGVWKLILPPKFLEGKHADTLSMIRLTMLLYSKKVYAELGESTRTGRLGGDGLQEVTTKLRMSLFIIFFCAGGAVILCILMIPTGSGIENIFRYHSEVWLSAVMFPIGTSRASIAHLVTVATLGALVLERIPCPCRATLRSRDYDGMLLTNLHPFSKHQCPQDMYGILECYSCFSPKTRTPSRREGARRLRRPAPQGQL